MSSSAAGRLMEYGYLMKCPPTPFLSSSTKSAHKHERPVEEEEESRARLQI